jgi:hypothetical protein
MFDLVEGQKASEGVVLDETVAIINIEAALMALVVSRRSFLCCFLSILP